jgi:hypothetical protein
VDPSTEQVASSTLEQFDLLLVDLKAGATAQETLDAMDILRSRDGILSVNPVYRGRTENESLLTDYFYVSVAAAADIYGEIEKRFARENLEVLVRNDYSNIGAIGYRLKVTRSARDASGETALDMANRYHKDPLTLGATPTFAPLWARSRETPSVSPLGAVEPPAHIPEMSSGTSAVSAAPPLLAGSHPAARIATAAAAAHNIRAVADIPLHMILLLSLLFPGKPCRLAGCSPPPASCAEVIPAPAPRQAAIPAIRAHAPHHLPRFRHSPSKARHSPRHIMPTRPP